MRTPHRQLPKLMNLMLLCLLLLAVPICTYARDVEFAWTANPEPVTGYKLYYKTGTENTPPYEGTGLNEGDSPILLGKVTTTTVTGLSVDETYQFSLKAYNDAGDSDYTAAVPILPVTFPSPAINIMSQN